MNKRLYFSTLSLLFFIFSVEVSGAKNLKPGFDIHEYAELLKLTSKNSDHIFGATMPSPEQFKLQYRSPVSGLDNVWELWLRPDNTAAISVRGSTETTESWMANFYAAMVPAKGTLQLGKNRTFDYVLAQHPQAAVHVGWLLSAAYMAEDIVQKIDSGYKAGITDFFIVGHSQGGGISFMLTAYLYNLQKEGKLPDDIRFKTYCSAGPKPGNPYFANEYALAAREGWAFNVVNVDDWVPEVPFSIQTVHDMNATNPFVLADKTIRKQPLLKRMVFKSVYRKMTKPAIKAQRNYQRYLGKMVSKSVSKHLSDFSAPGYYNSNFYVSTGRTILLKGSENYYRKYPQISEKFMTHHSFDAYLTLAEENVDRE